LAFDRSPPYLDSAWSHNYGPRPYERGDFRLSEDPAPQRVIRHRPMRLSLSGKHIGVAVGLSGHKVAGMARHHVGGDVDSAVLPARARHSFQAGKSAQIACGAAKHMETGLRYRRGRLMHRRKSRAAQEECLESARHLVLAAEADEVAEDLKACGAGCPGPDRLEDRDSGGQGGRQAHAPWRYARSDGPQSRAWRGLNVVYRLPDGTNGWIDTQPATPSRGTAWHQASQEGSNGDF
jgi:hypothetical protein